MAQYDFQNSRRGTRRLSKDQVRRTTRTRLNWATLSSIFLLLTVIFLIVAEVGDTANHQSLTSIYFISVRGHPALILLSLWSRIRSGAIEPSYKTIAAIWPGKQSADIRRGFDQLADVLEKPIEPTFEFFEDQFGLSKSTLEQRLRSGHLRSIGSIPQLARAAADLFPGQELNLQNVIPESVPNGSLLNTIAQTLGLHDFYTVGLWGYCQGFVGQGITNCYGPDLDYWFNPVEIIQSQLLAGASVQLPEDITRILKIIRIASHVMSAFFLTGACLSFALLFIKPLMVHSRWIALGMGILGFINAALVVIASVVATVLFVIMRNVLNDAQQVNIEAHIGNTMFAMIWIAAAFALLAWIIDLALMCCCTSRRKVRKQMRRDNKNAYDFEPEQS